MDRVPDNGRLILFQQRNVRLVLVERAAILARAILAWSNTGNALASSSTGPLTYGRTITAPLMAALSIPS